jgi:hypothetical protein
LHVVVAAVIEAYVESDAVELFPKKSCRWDDNVPVGPGATMGSTWARCENLHETRKWPSAVSVEGGGYAVGDGDTLGDGDGDTLGLDVGLGPGVDVGVGEVPTVVVATRVSR